MKIAYVITRGDAVGGASIHVRDMARAMLDVGHEATVLVGGEGPVTAQFKAAGIPFQSLRYLQRAINPLRDLRAVEELVRVLRKLQPELVSTHTAKAGLVGRSACARLGIPVLYTPHGFAIGSRISPILGPVFALLEKAAARWSGAIVCVCNYEKRLAIEKGIAAPGKFVVVHNGMKDVPSAMRADPGAVPVRICSVARFESPKDHETLLQALATLKHLEWQLDLVGDGPLMPAMRNLATKLGIAARVRFLGYLGDPAATLAGAQIFALSSNSEAFPRSILEAMRAGLPVVASDVGGVGEAVHDNVSGVLVPAGDAKAFARALAGLVESRAQRQLLGAAARLIYEEQFGFQRMVDKTTAVYANVLCSTTKSAKQSI